MRMHSIRFGHYLETVEIVSVCISADEWSLNGATTFTSYKNIEHLPVNRPLEPSAHSLTDTMQFN